MWIHLRKEIEQIRSRLNISEQRFRPLSITEWNDIQSKVFETFFHINKLGWPWERFKKENYAIQFLYNYPFKQLLNLVDSSEMVWLALNETVSEKNKFWFYEGFIKEIVSVLYESSLVNEVYVVSKKYEWLLCINHHDYLIASGEVMIEELKKLEATFN